MEINDERRERVLLPWNERAFENDLTVTLWETTRQHSVKEFTSPFMHLTLFLSGGGWKSEFLITH